MTSQNLHDVAGTRDITVSTTWQEHVTSQSLQEEQHILTLPLYRAIGGWGCAKNLDQQVLKVHIFIMAFEEIS